MTEEEKKIPIEGAITTCRDKEQIYVGDVLYCYAIDYETLEAYDGEDIIVTEENAEYVRQAIKKYDLVYKHLEKEK